MTTITESFTNTNGTELSVHNAAWVGVWAGSNIEIYNNEAAPYVDNAVAILYRHSTSMSPDQHASITVKTVSDEYDMAVGVATRISADGRDQYFYVAGRQTRYVAVVLLEEFTYLAMEYSAANSIAVNDVIKLETIGTTITPYINGSVDPDLSAYTDASVAAGYAGIVAMPDILTYAFRFDDWEAGPTAPPSGDIEASLDEILSGMNTDLQARLGYELLPPDAIAASANLTGSVAFVQNAVDNAGDATWLTATSPAAAITARFTFPSPVGIPSGQQMFRYRVRKTSGSPTPTIVTELLQAGVTRRQLSSQVNITSLSGQIVSDVWDSSDLVSVVDGSDVEWRITSTPGYSQQSIGAMPAYAGTGPAYASATFGSTNSVSMPAVVDAGDLLICQALCSSSIYDGSATMSASGWHAFSGNSYGGTNRARQALFWKIADGSEDGGTVNVRTYGSSGSSLAFIAIHRFTATNGFAANPIASIGLTKSPTGILSDTAWNSEVTPTGTNQLAVFMLGIGSYQDTFEYLDDPVAGTWTERAFVNTAVGSDGCLACQTLDRASGDPVYSADRAFSGPNSAWTALTFVLVPGTVNSEAQNTVEIGAIEWGCTSTEQVSQSYTLASDTFTEQ